MIDLHRTSYAALPTSTQVNINDTMAATLTPPDSIELSERRDILCDLAKALKKQGKWWS